MPPPPTPPLENAIGDVTGASHQCLEAQTLPGGGCGCHGGHEHLRQLPRRSRHRAGGVASAAKMWAGEARARRPSVRAAGRWGRPGTQGSRIAGDSGVLGEGGEHAGGGGEHAGGAWHRGGSSYRCAGIRAEAGGSETCSSLPGIAVGERGTGLRREGGGGGRRERRKERISRRGKLPADIEVGGRLPGDGPQYSRRTKTQREARKLPRIHPTRRNTHDADSELKSTAKNSISLRDGGAAVRPLRLDPNRNEISQNNSLIFLNYFIDAP